MTPQSGLAIRSPKISVIIPALNEAENLPHVFARMPPDLHEVILVDGRSADDTIAVARNLRPDVRVVTQTRTGKGNALACGFAAATGDVIAMIDADGSADPAEIPRFVTELVHGAQFAKGTRFSKGGRSDDITALRRLGNRLLTAVFNILYDKHYSDLCYGFNVFWRKHVHALALDPHSQPKVGNGRLWGDGFEIETLIHLRVAKAGLVVVEVASHEHSRIHGVSNLNAFSDGMRVLRTIVKERRSQRPRTRRAIRRAASLPETGRVAALTSTDQSPAGPVPGNRIQPLPPVAGMPTDESTAERPSPGRADHGVTDPEPAPDTGTFTGTRQPQESSAVTDR